MRRILIAALCAFLPVTAVAQTAPPSYSAFGALSRPNSSRISVPGTTYATWLDPCTKQ